MRAEITQTRWDEKTALEIYCALARRGPKMLQDLSYVGLASHRLGQAVRAAEILTEATIAIPANALLAEHDLRLCVEQRRLRWLIDTLDTCNGQIALSF